MRREKSSRRDAVRKRQRRARTAWAPGRRQRIPEFLVRWQTTALQLDGTVPEARSSPAAAKAGYSVRPCGA